MIWVQDEPANMGAWPYMALHLPEKTGRRIAVISRPPSSAPASGSAKTHAAEQAAILEAVFAEERLTLYFTDRGIEELEERRGTEQVALSWLAERLRDFVDENPDAEATVDRLASWLARLDEETDE